ncbi:MAG: sigma 54-interacting transcriptional regulator [Deltaproteobacteria bacterium]|nr:MAG: sigma 54-interacting transcriptional regulator [Deltaproteobacteria bacterium]
MRPKTLKQKLFLTVSVLVIISGISISQLVAHRYSASLIEGAVARAENIAHNLALDAVDKILINDLVALQKLLDDQMRSDPSVTYLFVVKDDRILNHTFSEGVPVNLIKANILTPPHDKEHGHLKKIISEQGDHYLDVAWPIFSGKAGTLRLGMSEKPYRRQVTYLWLKMSMITVGILLFSLIVIHFFIKRITQPLSALKNAVEKIDEGNLDTRVDVKGHEEVNTLASSFNGMLARIKEYTHRLEEKNLELDRTHRQLRTSFAISQELSALPGLKDVCTYLIEKFQSIVACQHMVLLIFSSNRRDLFVLTEKKFQVLNKDSFESAFSALQALETLTFAERDIFNSTPLAVEFQSAKRLAIFPFHHENELLGSMLVACPGDCHCLEKDLDVIELLMNQTSGAIKRAVLYEEEIRNLRIRMEHTEEYSGLIGKDPKMQVIYKLIEDIAPTDATVLIQGESGTGKELVARALHGQSPRKNMPFVVINCSAYPSTLLESELFGHEKGAFTGAIRQKSGRFEQADGGTVFLDEIGEIPPSAQIKLLRVLQSQKFERLGGEQTLAVNLRVLAATNKNLLHEVKSGQFREDLFYRLNVIPIDLPPLRQRPNDIPRLARHFLSRFAGEQNKTIQGVSSEAMLLLLGYPWPGNVRELENTIEHAAVLAKGNHIDVTDLPPLLRQAEINNTNKVSRKAILENEKKLIQEVLEECSWNKKEAAIRLGISRSTLYGKLKKYQISEPTIH